jgi:hypothetical protein
MQRLENYAIAISIKKEEKNDFRDPWTRSHPLQISFQQFFRQVRYLAVLGTRYILVRIRIRLFFSVTLRMQKNVFSIFFYYNLPAATLPSVFNLLLHYRQSLIYCFKDKFCVKILFCKHYFSELDAFMRKGKDPDPYL